jgi:hypothetical protein
VNWIYSLNRWYDDLDDTHPNLRFLLCFIPMGIFITLIFQNYSVKLSLLGLLGMALFAVLRIIPFVFPQKTQS